MFTCLRLIVGHQGFASRPGSTRKGWQASTFAVVAFLRVLASPAAAQNSVPPNEILNELPVVTLFSWLETTRAEVVTDRFNSGGLNLSEPSRVGGFFNSWSQTRYHLGDIDMSSAIDGTPLVFPSLAWWDRVDVDATLMPIDGQAPGLGVRLLPREPSQSWSGMFEGSTSGGPLTHQPNTVPPPVTSLDQSTRAAGLVSGPLSQRLRVALGAEWATATLADARSDVRRHDLASAFSHIVVAAPGERSLRALALVQRVSGNTAAHLQGSLESRRRDAWRWRVYAGHTFAERDPRVPRPQQTFAERLTHGPVPALIGDRLRDERLWSVGVHVWPKVQHRRHVLALQGDVSRASVREAGEPGRVVWETVDGQPARIWEYYAVDVSKRHTVSTLASIRDQISLSTTLTLDAAVRLEHVSGRADEAAAGISWTSVSPALQMLWDWGTRFDLHFVVGVRRSPHRLLLQLLAVGDRASPYANVHRWEGFAAGRGPLVARVGPGVRSDPAFSAIDSELSRPRTDEFVIGLESRPRAGLRLAVTGLARRQSRTAQLVNVGVTGDDYQTMFVPDANADLARPEDDQVLPVYDRLPASFGHDRYLLTNPPLDAGTTGALVITAESVTDRLFLSLGATAAASIGSGANRGFRPVENDPEVLGEILSSPNATTYARGRLFSDRAYTIKSSIVYRFPADIRVGIIARYQDGQPFARLVVVPGLGQGVDGVQAFARGRSRFAFTGTLDLRLQKRIRLGGGLDVLLDVYNLLNMRKEVEEYVVTGPRFRTPLAVQPPPSVHVGLRVRF